MRFSLDTKATTPERIGARDGVPAARLQALARPLFDLQARLDEATAHGLLPHLALTADQVSDWMGQGAAWREGGRRAVDRVLVLGEPGAVAAALALLPADASSRVAGIDRPELAAVDLALAGARRPRLLVLHGPAWVLPFAATLAPRFSALTLLSEEPLEPAASAALPEADCRVAPGSCDPRFGVLGAASFLLAGFAGLDPQPLRAALDERRLASRLQTLKDNPGHRLGALAALLAHAGFAAPVLVVGAPGLDAWARWAAGAWTAIKSRAVPVPGGVAARGGLCPRVRLGDEAAMQGLLEGPRGGFVLVLEQRGEGPEARWAQALSATLRAQVARQQLPLVAVLVDDPSPATRLALSDFWLQAALVAAALDPVDPLTMNGADAFRELLVEALAASSAPSR